jgi:hypothetical protein
MGTRGAKAAVLVSVSVFGWVFVYLFLAHSWALFAARESIMGPAGFVGTEVVRIAPTLAYFLLVGVVMGHLAGVSAGARGAALASAIAMAIEALVEHQIFVGGIDPLAVVVLAVNYLLPIAVAIAGAFITRLWQSANDGTVAT